MSAKEDLYNFVNSAVKGIVNEQEKAEVQVVESGRHTVNLIINCSANDLKFVYSKLKAIKFIAIAIAQRHKHLVNVLVDH